MDKRMERMSRYFHRQQYTFGRRGRKGSRHANTSMKRRPILKMNHSPWPRTPDLPHATPSTSVSSRQTRFYARRKEKATQTWARARTRSKQAIEKRPGRGTGPGVYSLLKSDEPEAKGGMQMPRLRRITSRRPGRSSERPRWKSQGAAEQCSSIRCLSFVRGASYSGSKSCLVAVEQIYG